MGIVADVVSVWAFILGIFLGFSAGILVQALWDDYRGLRHD
jgi:hypothetical protein